MSDIGCQTDGKYQFRLTYENNDGWRGTKLDLNGDSEHSVYSCLCVSTEVATTINTVVCESPTAKQKIFPLLQWTFVIANCESVVHKEWE